MLPSQAQAPNISMPEGYQTSNIIKPQIADPKDSRGRTGASSSSNARTKSNRNAFGQTVSACELFSAKMRLCQFASQRFLGFWSKLFLSAPFQVLSTWKCKGPQTKKARLGFAPSPASECMSKGTSSYLVPSQFNEAEH